MSVLLDTNIVLYFLSGRLAEPLPVGPLAISVITELELLSFPALDAAGESTIRTFLSQVTVLDLAGPVKDAAVAARRTHGLRLPDAIVVGTASAHGLSLLTNDERLVRKQVVETRSLRLK
ncbi:MAG: type II toxin-antitoxin system VapC family toxin [Phycisphaerales bacterium]|nr:type II toxin-antitoxin system VapC family toxin [Phycisphaerales bacterium]